MSLRKFRLSLKSWRKSRRTALLGLAALLCLGIIAAYVEGSSLLQYGNLTSRSFSPQELSEDFIFLRKSLQEGHPGLYRYTPKAEMDRLFDETQQKLNQPMDETQFYRILAPLIAQIKDGHTVLHPATTLVSTLMPEQVFPFSVRVLDNHLFIHDDFTTSDQNLVGARILSINEVPADTILQTLLADTPGDGNITTGKTELVGRGTGAGFFRALFAPMLYPLLGIRSPFTLKYQLPNQTGERTIQISGQDFATLVKTYEKKYPTEARPPLLPDGTIMPPNQPQFFDNGAIAVWKFPGSIYTPEDIHGAFIATGFQQIQAHGSSTLILDIRDYGGGVDTLGAIFFSYLADEPFRYYDDLVANALTFSFLSQTRQADPLPADEFALQADGKYHWVKHPNWGFLQPRQPHFAGKVYALISGVCFSACAELASTLHFHQKATFIGEEVGGDYYGNTSGFLYQVFLPHTKIALDIPVVAYYLSVHDYPATDQGVMPDYPVQSTAQDWLAGNDSGMTLALKLARGQHP